MAEDELHAYVDGHLPAGRKGSVESFLSAAPGEQERVEAYQRQNIELHRLYDRPTYETIPPHYGSLAERLGRAIRRQRMARRLLAGAAAAGVAGLALLAGWSGYERLTPAEYPLLAFAQQATKAHMMAMNGFAGSGAGEIKASADGQSWSAGRFAATLLPSADLAKNGFTLVGGRFLPSGHGAAVQLVYVNKNGRHVTLFVGPATSGHRGAFTIFEQDDVALIYWQVDNLGYSLIGNVDRRILFELAETIAGATTVAGGAKSNEAVQPAPVQSEAASAVAPVPPVLTMPPLLTTPPETKQVVDQAVKDSPEPRPAAPTAVDVRDSLPSRPRKASPAISDVRLKPRT